MKTSRERNRRPDLEPGIRRRPFLFGLLAVAGTPLVPAVVGADKPKAIIGVSVLTLTNPFFRDLADAITAEARKHGMTTIVTSGDFDPARQRNQVADFIVRKVNAMVLCPCDSKAVGTAIAEANKAGIPVFTADIASLAKEGKVVGHVATDNFGGGKLAAVALIEALGGRGKVAILDHPEVESVILRTKGFHDELARQKREKAVTIEVVATLPGGAAKDRSMKAMEDLLQSHPELNGVFAINDPSALGAVAALEKAGKLAQVKVVGFDGMPEGKAAIKAGRIYADPIQFPDRIGQTAVQNIVKYLAGDDVPAETLIPTALYRKADAEKDATVK
jgi:ribose transport system substrate-binding protein